MSMLGALGTGLATRLPAAGKNSDFSLLCGDGIGAGFCVGSFFK
jgi:hypothetical protein